MVSKLQPVGRIQPTKQKIKTGPMWWITSLLCSRTDKVSARECSKRGWGQIHKEGWKGRKKVRCGVVEREGDDGDLWKAEGCGGGGGGKTISSKPEKGTERGGTREEGERAQRPGKDIQPDPSKQKFPLEVDASPIPGPPNGFMPQHDSWAKTFGYPRDRRYSILWIWYVWLAIQAGNAL